MIENTRFHEGYYSHIRKTQSDTELDMVCHTGTITMIAKYEKYPGTGDPYCSGRTCGELQQNTENRASVSNSCIRNFRFPRNFDFNKKVIIM